MAMPMKSRKTGSQNSDEPQTEQKPRRTFSDERYQEILSSPRMVTAVRGMSVETK